MAEELRGWKDIGAYFGASDRTAQRWEREHGMPVHRTGRTRGASVFALREELDAWRLSAEGQRARHENGKAESEIPDAPEPLADGTAGTPPASSWWRSHRNTALILAVAALLVLVMAVGWFAYVPRFSHGRGGVSVPGAYTIPKSGAVFVLNVSIGDTPFVFHVLDGGMATLAVRGGPKLGFEISSHAGVVRLIVVDLSTKGTEWVNELEQVAIKPKSPIRVKQLGLTVEVEWIDLVNSSDLPSPPPDVNPSCCIVCVRGPVPADGDITGCAAQVSGSNCGGSCCGFSGCKKAK